MSSMFVQSSFRHILITSVMVVYLVFVTTRTCSGWEEEEAHAAHCRSHLFNCGSIRGVGYPFRGGNRYSICGRSGFELTCVNNQYPLLEIGNRKFRVLEINQSSFTMRIASEHLWKDVCSFNDQVFNFTLDNNSPFSFGLVVPYISIFYSCTSNVATKVLDGFTCPQPPGIGDRDNRTVGFYADMIVESPRECQNRINIPILSASYQQLWGGNLTLKDALNQGFEIQYDKDRGSCSACDASGGVCGSETLFHSRGPEWMLSDKFVCFCLHGSDPFTCHGPHGIKRKIPLAVTLGASAFGMGVLVVGLIMCWSKWQPLSDKLGVRWSNIPNDDQSLEEFIKRHGSLAPKRYSYSDIKKMTNSLKDKLGQGGFGSVYKGKLPDGHLVAVKVLNVMKGNGEDFINEVASISRTSHVNVVTLKGYCLQGRKRALVYDFMPQGSLEKFICNETNPPKVGLARLDWETLYRITVGIARGLEYLHSGCNTRILHFDIKPHNILLDDDFCPKISDFGLAKLCTGKKTIVSMVGARGTVGYIAPEVFCRNFGGVSYKSDVYSYGMMILEMVGARKKVVDGEVDGSSSSECYFPHWIYKRLEAGVDLELQADMTKEESEITKKMTMVGLWCIQTDPSQRPSMGRVLDMLEGSIHCLEFPPQPFLKSPSRPPAEYFTTLTLS